MTSQTSRPAPDVNGAYIRQLLQNLHGLEAESIISFAGFEDKNYLLTGLTKSATVTNNWISKDDIVDGTVLKITAPNEAEHRGLEGQLVQLYM